MGNNKGKHWYNNGIKAIVCFDDNVPEGYIKGNLPISDIAREHMSISLKGKKAWNKDIKMSDEFRQKQSNRMQGVKLVKGMHWWNNGVIQKRSVECPGKGFVLGKFKPSEEVRKKYASSTGKSWFNNGIDEILCFDCPDGYIKGRLEVSEETKKKLSNKVRTHITHVVDRSDFSEEFKSMYYNKQLSIDFVKEHFMTRRELSDYFNCSISTIYDWIKRFDLTIYIKDEKTHYEKELADLFPEINFAHNNRTALNGYEIDLYYEEKKIGIEFNGTYWHCSLNKPKKYHEDKSKLAEKKGIRLIHIYEHEWTNENIKPKIIMMLNIAFGLNNVNKIYARNCEIREITNQEAKALNEKIHLQGHRNAQVTYGLFYNNELVQLMSFSRCKYNKNLHNDNEWEIIRGCPGSNNIVVGGVSKLFSHFIKDYHPSKVFSYCDFNKFDGRSYEALGMKFIGYTGPDMKWVMKDGSVVNRSPSKRAELKANSVAQIFGAGSKKYIWENA